MSEIFQLLMDHEQDRRKMKRREKEILQLLEPGEVIEVEGVFWRHEVIHKLVRVGHMIKSMEDLKDEII